MEFQNRDVYLFLRKDGENLSFEALTDQTPSIMGDTVYYGPICTFNFKDIPIVSKKLVEGVFDSFIICTRQGFKESTDDQSFIGKTIGNIRKNYGVVLRQPQPPSLIRIPLHF